MTTALDRTATAPLVRVERGRPSDDELAALTVALLSRAARAADAPADRPATPAVPLWDRPERHAPYRPPVSWRG